MMHEFNPNAPRDEGDALPSKPRAKPRKAKSSDGGGRKSDGSDLKFSAIELAQVVAEFSIDGQLTRGNANFLAMVGFAESEAVGQHHTAFVLPAHRDSEEYRATWGAATRGEPRSGLHRLLAKGGKEVWLQGSYAPVFDAKKQVAGVILAGFDVTQAVEKTNAAEQELKIRSDIMDMTSIVSYADLKGDILSINQKFIDVSKYPKDELVGRPHNTTRHPDMPKEVFKELWSTIGRGRIFRGVIKNPGEGRYAVLRRRGRGSDHGRQRQAQGLYRCPL